MSTAAIFAQGTLLKIGDGGGSEVFTTIAEVRELKGPGMTAAVVDVTSHDSTGGWREKISGLLDAGQFTFTINYQPQAATHSVTSGLLKDMKNRTQRNFKLVMPDIGATTWSFKAVVTKFDIDFPVDKELSASLALDIIGQPTFA